MCPDSEINDMQGVRMLQNSIANVPNLANVLILCRQTKASAGLPDKITLHQFVALLSQQAQVYDNGRIRSGRNYRRSAANHELDYEVNAHNVDEDEESLDEWFEANVMNQRDPKTGRYLRNRNGNKNTGFKKTQNNQRQANQMQGNQSRAFMNRDTWNAFEDSDKKAWDQLSDPAKTKITAYHFNKGKEYAAQGSEVNQMEAKEHDLIFDDSDEELEAKQHDLVFDDPEEEEETAVEVNNFEAVQVSNAESTHKLYEDEGVDFDMILQAQQANTRLQVRTHELLDSESSDEESVADLEVNMHNLRPKVQGLLEFSDSEDEDEQALNQPITMEELLDTRGEIDDTDIPEDQSIEQKSTAKMFEGMLQFSDSEDEDEDKFQLQTYGFTSSIEETGNEGIIGEQEGNLSSLTDSNTDRRRLVDEFYAHDGLMHFSDSKDEAEEKVERKPIKEETKVMTRSEYERAKIAPPPASKAPYPKDRRSRSLSPKPTSQLDTKTTSPSQTPKVPLSTQVAHQVAKQGRGHKVNISVATDMLLESTDPGYQPGSVAVNHLAPSPKPASIKTFASVASTPKTPIVTKPQQASPTVQTPNKPTQAKTEVKKTSPGKGKQPFKKGPNQFKGKVDSKPEQVTMSQKLADTNKQIAIKAKQADETDSPKMKKSFAEVTKPIKTTERIVESLETPDGKGFQLLSEEEKQKVDRAKKFEAMGLLHFSDDEEDELSLETITSDKSKGLNKSQGSQKLMAKPKLKQPIEPKQPVEPEKPITPK